MEKEVEFSVKFKGKEYFIWKDANNGLWYTEGCSEGFGTLNALSNILEDRIFGKETTNKEA